MTTNKQRTRETLFSVKRTTFQRMRVCLDIDVPEADFVRDNFNAAVLEIKSYFEQANPGCVVVYVSSEDG